MIDFKIVLIILLFVFFVYYFICNFNENIYVRSSLDNNMYLIRNGKFKSNQFLTDSANTLAIINIKILKLIDHLTTNYHNDPDKFYFIKKLKEKYHPGILSEAAIDNRYTTYTIDKRDINICLRTRDQFEKLYDPELLMYVVGLHELSHLCNYDRYGNEITGHGIEFKLIFQFLTQEAIKIGVYKYTNYAESPAEYCGLNLTSNIIG